MECQVGLFSVNGELFMVNSLTLMLYSVNGELFMLEQ